MKKHSALALLLGVLFLLAGCSTSAISAEDYNKLESDYKALQNDYIELGNDYKELYGQYTDLFEKHKKVVEDFGTALDLCEELMAEVESLAGTGTQGAQDAGKVVECYSDDFVTISYSHCESSSDKYKVVLVVENKTSTALAIGCNSFAVENWNLSDAFCYQDVAASSKGYVKISTKELPTLTPNTISGSLYVADKSKTLFGKLTYDAVFSDVKVNSDNIE